MARELQPCGTPAAYLRHRRRGEPIDQACREAENARCRPEGQGPRQPARHGTKSKYNKGCRCEECTRANRERSRAWRAAVSGLADVVPEWVPHGEGGYRNYGCRCPVCVAAGSAGNRAYRERRKAAAAAAAAAS